MVQPSQTLHDGYDVFDVLDFLSCFWQMIIYEEDIPNTAFACVGYEEQIVRNVGCWHSSA